MHELKAAQLLGSLQRHRETAAGWTQCSCTVHMLCLMLRGNRLPAAGSSAQHEFIAQCCEWTGTGLLAAWQSA